MTSILRRLISQIRFEFFQSFEEDKFQEGGEFFRNEFNE